MDLPDAKITASSIKKVMRSIPTNQGYLNTIKI
jgi:hypothetical protein